MNDLNAPTVIAACSHEMEAGLLINVLEQHGIKAKSTGEAVAGFRAEVPGDVKVLVSTADLERAKSVLSEFSKADESDIDRPQIDIGNPSPEVHHSSRNRILGLVITFGLVVFTFGILWQLLAAFGF